MPRSDSAGLSGDWVRNSNLGNVSATWAPSRESRISCDAGGIQTRLHRGELAFVRNDDQHRELATAVGQLDHPVALAGAVGVGRRFRA